MPRDDFDRWIEEMPEAKLELIDGRLVVGNGEAGNRQLLADLLNGWGPEAAVCMAAPESWWQALHVGFREFDPPAAEKPPEVWHSWAGQLSYQPRLRPAGPMVAPDHRGARQRLMMCLFGLAREQGFAHVSGRDVIMRLGDDAFTPDVFVVGPVAAPRLNQHYLDGAADLVMEVLLPGHEAQDRQFKRDRYGRGGVAEYWIVDPARRSVELLRWQAHQYRPQPLDADGTYRPACFPGLRFTPDRLWEGDSWGHGPDPFVVEQAMPPVPKGYGDGGVSWGDLPFEPRPGREPQPISFEKFAAWAPEAKFERIDGKPWVGGSRGSRNVLGLLLRTAGLREAVRILHPRQWVAALRQQERERAEDSERREHWWGVARRAAAELRNRFGYGRLTVIGDLIRSRPLNLWSDITLVAFDIPERKSTWDASHFLFERYRDEPDMNLLKYEHASRSEQEEVAAGVEV